MLKREPSHLLTLRHGVTLRHSFVRIGTLEKDCTTVEADEASCSQVRPQVRIECNGVGRVAGRLLPSPKVQ